MATIVGGSLILFGLISIGAANYRHFAAEAELLEKRPELQDELYYRWLPFRKHHVVDRLYKAEFPEGKKTLQFQILAVAGMAAFFLGVIVFGSSQ